MALNEMQRGLWGDTFCIRWVAKWLNISIGIWSLNRKTRYLLFNPTANINPYCILFHDANPSSGHYEPLLYKKLTICNFEPSNSYLSFLCKELQHHWSCISNNMKLHGLNITTTYIENYGDSFFNAICHLIATDFNLHASCTK